MQSKLDPAGNTVPKLLLRNAQRFADRPSIREKDLGIWQTWSWAQVLDEVRLFAIGSEPAWADAGRHRRHRRRQPAAALLGASRHSEPRRHSRARLSGRGGRRDGLCPGACRRQDGDRRKPGTGRQDSSHRRSRRHHPAHRLRCATRTEGLRPRPPARLRACAEHGPRGSEEPRQHGRGLAVGSLARKWRRRRRHALHIRHDGQSEGRRPHACGDDPRRPYRHQDRQSQRERLRHRLPAVGVGRRSPACATCSLL